MSTLLSVRNLKKYSIRSASTLLYVLISETGNAGSNENFPRSHTLLIISGKTQNVN